MHFSWQQLKKPFFVLAPMEGGTDTVFRQIVMSCGKPDAVFTEFTNVEGLLSKGKEEVGKRLLFAKNEHPIIAQIWGITPSAFYEAARQVSQMGFDGIDINMGCPERTVVKHGACSALIENPSLAKEIIKAVKKGAPNLPISVKTRIGFKTIQTEEWISFLLKQNLDALTVHFRTQKEMSNVPAHWDEAKKVVFLRGKISPKTIIIGNGDVETKKEGLSLSKKYKLDGIMIGRGVFHNPYVFNERINYEAQTKKQRIKLLIKHLDLFEKTWKEKQKYAPLKRFFKIYISSFEGAADMREKLMLTQNTTEARKVLKNL
jgi:tRNA-dihydrouridine synthase